MYSKDLANFRKIVYLPKIKDKVSEMMYKENDFNDGNIASQKGDDAIKLLYIPPFALSVSILALLLNTFTIFGMVLSILNIPAKVLNGLKAGFILVVILIPIFSSYDSFDNKLIKQSTTSETQTYLDFLSWISYYEKVNSELHE